MAPRPLKRGALCPVFAAHLAKPAVGLTLPLARPALAAVAIFTFLGSWNLYLEPIVFLSTPDRFTLPQALTQFTDAYGGPMWNIQLAAATMTAIPVLVVFIVAQKQFVEGLAHTGLKG